MQEIKSFTKQLDRWFLSGLLERRDTANTKNYLPSTLHIETTTVCNLSCEYCVLGSNMYEKKVMGVSEFKSFKNYFKS